MQSRYLVLPAHQTGGVGTLCSVRRPYNSAVITRGGLGGIMDRFDALEGRGPREMHLFPRSSAFPSFTWGDKAHVLGGTLGGLDKRRVGGIDWNSWGLPGVDAQGSFFFDGGFKFFSVPSLFLTASL